MQYASHAAEDPSLIMSMYGILFCTRGLGNILSTPISTALAPVQLLPITDSGTRQGIGIDGGRFAHLIGYIGACFAAATLTCIVGWYWDKVLEDRVPVTV